MRVLAALLTAITGLGCLACVSPSDPMARAYALKEAQKRYTEAIRWGDLERAAHYVDPELREDFLAQSRAFESIRFTDFEIGAVDLEDEDKLRAEVDVTYSGYVLPFYIERRVNDHQVWVREEGMANRWLVQPELELLITSMLKGPSR